jgi:hypothetical protein
MSIDKKLVITTTVDGNYDRQEPQAANYRLIIFPAPCMNQSIYAR